MYLLILALDYDLALANAIKNVGRNLELAFPKTVAVLKVSLPTTLYQIQTQSQNDPLIKSLSDQSAELNTKFANLQGKSKAIAANMTDLNRFKIVGHLFLLEVRRFGKLLLALLKQVKKLWDAVAQNGRFNQIQLQNMFTHSVFGKQ